MSCGSRGGPWGLLVVWGPVQGHGGYRSGLEMHGPCSLVLLPGTLGVSSARWSLSPLPWQRQRQHLYVRENLGLNIDDCSPGSCLHPPV